jgi:crossover junction endodeoxyribonuclease RuvC
MILAIDASSKVIGVALLSHDRAEAGEIQYKDLLHTFRAIDKLIKTYRPSFIAIEDTYLGPNPTTFKVLERVRAIAYLAARWNCIADDHIIQAGASTIRKHVFGNGRITKEEACERLERFFKKPLKTKGFDASDSMALCCYAAGIPID